MDSKDAPGELDIREPRYTVQLLVELQSFLPLPVLEVMFGEIQEMSKRKREGKQKGRMPGEFW